MDDRVSIRVDRSSFRWQMKPPFAPQLSFSNHSCWMQWFGFTAGIQYSLNTATTTQATKQTNVLLTADTTFTILCRDTRFLPDVSATFTIPASTTNANPVVALYGYNLPDFVLQFNLALARLSPTSRMNVTGTYFAISSSDNKLQMTPNILYVMNESDFVVDLRSCRQLFGILIEVSAENQVFAANTGLKEIYFRRKSNYALLQQENILFVANYGTITVPVGPCFLVDDVTGQKYATLNDLVSCVNQALINYFSLQNPNNSDLFILQNDVAVAPPLMVYSGETKNKLLMTMTFAIKLQKNITNEAFDITFADDLVPWIGGDIAQNNPIPVMNFNLAGPIAICALSVSASMCNLLFQSLQKQQPTLTLPLTPGPYYSREQLLIEMNATFQRFNSSSTSTLVTDKVVFITTNTDGFGQCMFSLNPLTFVLQVRVRLILLYNESDFMVVFFNTQQDACLMTNGNNSSNHPIAAWNNVLGFYLGFTRYTEYMFTSTITTTTATISYFQIYGFNAGAVDLSSAVISADSAFVLNKFNNIILVLCDYVNSHIDSNIITIDTSQDEVPKQSLCTNNQLQGLTQAQQYSIQQTNDANAATKVNINSITNSGYNVDNVFAVIPMENVAFGSTYVNDSVVLQQQMRQYFGPVKLYKLSVLLITEKSSVPIDLNNANWSCSILCEAMA